MTFIQRLGLLLVIIGISYLTSQTPVVIVTILFCTIGGTMFLYEKIVDKTTR